MKTVLIFQDGKAQLKFRPEDQWEQLLLGALCNGDRELTVKSRIEWEGHPSNNCSKSIELTIAPFIE